MKFSFGRAFDVFVNYFCSIWLGLLVLVILKMPIELVVGLSVLSERIVEATLLTVGMAFALFWLFFRTGYKNKKYNIATLIMVIVVIFLLQHLVCLWAEFYGPHFSSSAKTICEAFIDQHEIDPFVHPLYNHICLAVLQVFYLPFCIFGEMAGAKRRLKNISRLIEKSDSKY